MSANCVGAQTVFLSKFLIMIRTIVSDYPWQYPILCFIGALALTAVSYYRNKKLAEFQPVKIYILSALRFLALFLTSILLLNIFVKTKTDRTEKPILAIAVDNSESMIMRGSGSGDSLKSFVANMLQSSEKLKEKYSVKFFKFGETVSQADNNFDFSDKYTNFSEMFESMKSILYNTNAGAMVVCSDGIFNKGQNPVYSSTSLGKKIYTVTLGDTAAYKDLSITKTVYNETAFLGNEFPLEITINSKMLKGKTTLCKISHNGKTEFQSSIQLNSDNFSQEISTTLKAEQKGLQKYTISLSSIDGEITEVNNTREIVVDVVDDKYKILILSSMPHPDVAALRSALSINRGYDLEVSTLDEFQKSVSQYNLVILVQVPSVLNKAEKIISDIKNKNIPVMFVLGSMTDFDVFNSCNNCLSVSKNGNNFEDALFAENPQFSLLSFDNGVNEFLQKVPPLICAFGDYKLLPATQALGNQMIKNVTTSKPIIAVSEPSKSRQAVIAGEGLWRWRIDCYKRYLNHEKFDLLVSRIAQFLLTRNDRERFTIASKRIFSENEPVYFNAKVLDEMLEPVSDANVTIEISDDKDNKLNYKFDLAGSGYYLRIDNLLPGNYTYKATSSVSGKVLTKSGIFSVVEIKAEAENLTANHNILRKISLSTGGASYSSEDFAKLVDDLMQKDEVKPMIYSDISSAALMSLKWIFFVIVLLFAVEWFLRKFWGTL